MSLDVGIIGLEKSGRTTIFNCLTSLNIEAGSSRQEEHIGIARVPDLRVDNLKQMFKSKKAVYAEVKYIDLGASVKGIASDFNLSGKLLSQLGATDALLCVVRAFEHDSVPHPQLSVDPARDIEAMALELTYSDLAIIERRLERISAQIKAAKPAERIPLEAESELLNRIQKQLEEGIPLRSQPLTPDEQKRLSSYQFLSQKPLLTVLNIGESQLADASSMENDMRSRFGSDNHRILALAGKLEVEFMPAG
jgi:ribosome-binding ATPase YchF (GTP1/OBG family)